MCTSLETCSVYRKYAPHLVLLDATYKVCKYSLPLFFLVVQTNVNFQIVAVIVVEDESSELLIKALETVKQWNPTITPNYAMVDFDTGEFLALKTLALHPSAYFSVTFIENKHGDGGLIERQMMFLWLQIMFSAG